MKRDLPKELQDKIKNTSPVEARVLTHIVSEGTHLIVFHNLFGYHVNRYFTLGSGWVYSGDLRDGTEQDAWETVERVL